LGLFLVGFIYPISPPSLLLATLAGIILLGEALTRDLVVASLLILGGIWLMLRHGRV
jgi:uncharacterized membrane protein